MLLPTCSHNSGTSLYCRRAPRGGTKDLSKCALWYFWVYTPV